MSNRLLQRISSAWRYRDNPENAELLTRGAWYGMLVLVGIAVAGYLTYGAWMLVQVFTLAEAAPGVTPAETLSRQELQDVLEMAAQRQVNYDALVNSPRRVVDPGK